jgi:predicted nucleic acid-binding protein
VGSPVAANDARIAACCIAAGVPLMTLNLKHFEAIPGLTLLP